MKSEQADGIISLLENTNDVEVVFAAEGGSRGRNTAREDSDHDLWLLYAPSRLEMHTGVEPDSLELTADELEWPTEEKPAEVDLGKVELTGFSVRKFADEMLDGKEAVVPDMTESLKSQVVYRGEEFEQVTDYLASNFDPLTAYNHYMGIAEKFVEGGISDRKELLKAARTVSHAHYILETGEFPEQDFHEFLDELPEDLPSSGEELEVPYDMPSELEFHQFSDAISGQIGARKRYGDEVPEDGSERSEFETAVELTEIYVEGLVVPDSAYRELASDRRISGDELAERIQSALVDSPHYST
ncbi:MAG: DNA polymerase beta superfamily protein [Candidatus Nanohaloarchaea archaeon]